MIEENFSDTKKADYPVKNEGYGFEGANPMGIGQDKLFQNIYNNPTTTE